MIHVLVVVAEIRTTTPSNAAQYRANPALRPFEDRLYWAGFTYSGAY